MVRWTLPARARKAAETLLADLQALFGARLESLAVHGAWVQPEGAAEPQLDDDEPIHSLALVRALAFDDLSACADRAERWDGLGLAIPLLLSRDEFVSSLDAFPLEFGDILARHVTLAGHDPFDGVAVAPADLRRACEVQAKSHLIHLREGFLEAGGRPEEVARLIRHSASSFATLLASLARLEGLDPSSTTDLAGFAADRLGLSASLVRRVLGTGHLPHDEALQLYAPYHDAVSQLATHVDRWRGPAAP
ncbi:MAG TPA: hypothetical protein VIL35_14470 [Vicinamibacterales bacterium]